VQFLLQSMVLPQVSLTAGSHDFAGQLGTGVQHFSW
jgi:hypothetical protein